MKRQKNLINSRAYYKIQIICRSIQESYKLGNIHEERKKREKSSYTRTKKQK